MYAWGYLISILSLYVLYSYVRHIHINKDCSGDAKHQKIQGLLSMNPG